MSASNFNVNRLLIDARILLAHASVRGLNVPDDLRNAVGEAARRIQWKTFTVDDEHKLNKAISDLSQLTQSPLIVDLRKEYELNKVGFHDLFGFLARSSQRCGTSVRLFFRFLRRESWLAPILPNLVLYLTILLTLSTIGLTANFNQIASLVAELKVLEKAHYWEKIEEAKHGHQQYVAMLNEKEKKATSADIDKAYTQLQTLIENLRDVANGLVFNVTQLHPMIDQGTVGPNWCYLFLNIYGFGQHCGDTPPQEFLSSSAAATPSGESQASGTDAAASPLSPDSPIGVLAQAFQDNAQFALVNRLSVLDPSQMQTIFLYRRLAERVAVFLGGSILPLFYGLLGASVFLMRELFGETRQTMRPTHQLGKILLRLGLGGVAGLVIGWFWGPDEANSVAEAARVKFTTAPFALAFLAGFSIDLLFSLLDRIIRALNPETPGTSTSPVSPVPSAASTTPPAAGGPQTQGPLVAAAATGDGTASPAGSTS